MKITELSIGGEFSYVATILPDKEFRELPEVKANNHYGLINYFGFHINPLSKPANKRNNHQLQQFKFYIQIKETNGNSPKETYMAFYQDILTLLDAYGFEIKYPKTDIECPEGYKNKCRIYCSPIQLAGECPLEEYINIKYMLSFPFLHTYK